MSSTPKSNKYASDTDNQPADSGSGTGTVTPEPRSPLSRSATPSSKSFRATNRLARRARSFKEDFLEKISQMRNTATAPIGTAPSPTALGASVVEGNNRSGRETPTDGGGGALLIEEIRASKGMLLMGRGGGSPTVKRGVEKGPLQEFDVLTKQLQTALMYFRSSVANDKLEMLAGNGTIILDTVWAINLAVKSSCAAGLQSNTDMSWKIKEATQAMYHNASRLIKVCDDALLKLQEETAKGKKNDSKIEDEETKAKKKVYRDTVENVLSTLEESVKSLLNIARDPSLALPPKPHTNHNHHHHHPYNNHNHLNTTGSQQQLLLLRPPSPSANAPAQQRNSLPDIPLTPRERELLHEKQQLALAGGNTAELGDCVDGTKGRLGKNSFSSESVLKDAEGDGGVTAPPKPPLPQSLALRSLFMGSCMSPPPLPPKKNKFGKYGFENMAYIDQISNNLERSSRSPEDSISLLSASAGSLDSMLNHSREEEEIKSLMEHTDSDTVLENDISDAFVTSHQQTTVTSSSSHNSSSNHQQVSHQACGNRLSNTDSGVVSMHSLRNSSCSKRSSVTSSSSNAIKHVEVSNNESIVRTASVETESSTQQHTYHHHQSSHTSHTSTSSSNSSSTVSMLSSNNNNNNNHHSSHNMLEHCRLDSTATTTTTEDDDEYEFKFKHLGVGSVEFDCDEDDCEGERHDNDDDEDDMPPALPQKMKKQQGGRVKSPYDNVVADAGGHKGAEFIVTCQMHQSHQSLSSSVSMASSISQDNGRPPPLPPKKKHIMAYMEMFGNCSHANDEFMRHSVHMMHGGNWAASGPSGAAAAGQLAAGQQVQAMSSTQSCSFSSQNTTWRSQSIALHQLSIDSNPSLSSPCSTHHHHPAISKVPLAHPHFSSTPSTTTTKSPLTTQQSIPPALPPKRLRTASTLATPPPSPPPPTQQIPAAAAVRQAKTSTGSAGGNEKCENRRSAGEGSVAECIGHGQVSAQLPDLLEHTTAAGGAAAKQREQQLQDPSVSSSGSANSGSDEKWHVDLMEATEIEDYLVLKKADEDMPDVRGGSIDALIIQASMVTRNSGFSYQEAFLTTYRTFITPYELITKLIRRYYFFYRQTDKKKRFREAFALIVCVVNDLVSSDLDTALHQMLMDFDQSLIADGELVLAKALRIKLLEKHENKLQTRQQLLSNQNNAANNNSTTAQTASPNVIVPSSKGSQTLLDFKSEQIAEQMTLLDAELFMRIEIPEVLIWVQEQKEETSPNLTRFTEHFNKMSYWARTRILLADARDRERYFVKFIKIMKQLRKINNFNSYLALLSALDSAPIRRLEWQKHVQDGLKEYCALIDSSSSFRAYRQALAETSPPSIPYIGLVLQDLTFVHIGNSNLLPNGAINFSKRWQQFHIVENMKRFKKCSYNFKRNDRIISYFQNFNEYISEDEMWSLSENIKPRRRKVVQ